MFTSCNPNAFLEKIRTCKQMFPEFFLTTTKKLWSAASEQLMKFSDCSFPQRIVLSDTDIGVLHCWGKQHRPSYDFWFLTFDFCFSPGPQRSARTVGTWIHTNNLERGDIGNEVTGIGEGGRPRSSVLNTLHLQAAMKSLPPLLVWLAAELLFFFLSLSVCHGVRTFAGVPQSWQQW